MKSYNLTMPAIAITLILLLHPLRAMGQEKTDHSKLVAIQGAQSHQPFLSEPVASVNGDSITVSELMKKMQNQKYIRRAMGKKKPNLSKQIKTKALNKLIDEKLALQHARSLEIAIPPETIQKHLDNFKNSSDTATTESLEKASIRIKDYLLVREMLKQEVNDKVNVTDKDIKKGYDVNIDKFTEKEIVTIHDIIFLLDPGSPESKKISLATVEKIQNDHNGDPLQLEPDDTFIVRENVSITKNDDLYALTRKMKVGELSSPEEINGTLHIVKLVKYQPEVTKSFQEARAVIARELEKNFKKEKLAALKASLRQNAKIEVFDIINSFDLMEN